MNYTLGPWRLGPINYADIYSVASGELLAVVVKDMPHTVEDARLISAVPELYEALKQYFSRGHHDTCSYSLSTEYACDCGYVLAAFALAKAKGESR